MSLGVECDERDNNTRDYLCESRFSIEMIENNQDKLRAAVVLRDQLDYNEKMIYHLMLTATVCAIYGL